MSAASAGGTTARSPRATSARAGSRQRRLLLDSILLGVCGALSAELFRIMLHWCNTLFLVDFAGYHAPALPSEGGVLAEHIGRFHLWLVPVATTVGGFIVGALTTWLAPEAEGHGTDTVVRAFHTSDGHLRSRVAPVKLVASAITIGSGGAAGREGPIALITAGFGSWYANVTKRSVPDRRILLLVGMAAGLSAIFRSPLGTAFFAIEALYFTLEFEAGALLYTALASIIAYGVNGLFVGWGPLFDVPANVGRLAHPWEYAWFLVLGLAAGVVATVVPSVFYRVRDGFHALPIPMYLRAPLGGLLMGLLALAVPQVIGGGYGWIQLAIDGKLVLGTLLILAFAKIIALAFTVASGGSGGVFAPSLFVGAMLGGACAAVAGLTPTPFVIVGMAAVFAGAARVPVATLIMVTEMTGGYTLLVPAALAVLLSSLVQNRLSSRLKYRSIYEAQVGTRIDSPAHRAQQLGTALRVLSRGPVPDLSGMGDLALVPVLRAGVPVDLPGGRRLVAGALKSDSALVGSSLRAAHEALDGADANVIAVLRRHKMLDPRPTLHLRGGDRLLVVADGAHLDQLQSHLDPW